MSDNQILKDYTNELYHTSCGDLNFEIVFRKQFTESHAIETNLAQKCLPKLTWLSMHLALLKKKVCPLSLKFHFLKAYQQIFDDSLSRAWCNIEKTFSLKLKIIVNSQHLYKYTCFSFSHGLPINEDTMYVILVFNEVVLNYV